MIELAKLVESAGGMESLVKDETTGLWIIPTVPETLVTFRQLEPIAKILALKAEAHALR